MEAKGRSNFHADFAYDVPALVLFRLVGVPEADVPKVKAWGANRATLTWGELSDEEQIPHAHAMVDYWRYCRDIVKRRHEDPTDDLPGDLVRVQQNGEEINDDEIAGVLYSILFAGHETTTNLMTNGLRELLLRPGQWRKLVEDPSRISNAVDECLRFSPSVIVWRRPCAGGRRSRRREDPEGRRACCCCRARPIATRPCSRTARPSTSPAPNADQHLSFGFGIHNCLGRQLARLEFSIALQELGRRFPSLRLQPDQSFEFLPIISFRVPRALEITWDGPAAAHAA